VTQGDAPSGYASRARVRDNRQVRHRASLTLGKLQSSEEPIDWVPTLVLACLTSAFATPTADAPTCKGGVLTCLHSLKEEEITFVLMRVKGLPWKAICRHFSISRPTANRRLEYLLSLIAWRLNGRPIPSTWSRRRLVDRARSLSSPL
jgi:hypothetical protein